MIKAVIFDMDGVIVDSNPINIEAGVISFREIGIELDEKDKKVIVGRHPADYLEILSKKYKFDKEKMLKIQLSHYYKLYKSVKLLKGAKELILDLKKKELRLALTTSSRRKYADMVLQRFNFKNVFDVIVSFEDCDKRKPAPDAYLLTAKKLGIKNENCLVFEDTVIGIEAAKNAGIKCIAVPNKYAKNDDFSKADLIVNSLKEVNWEKIKELDC